MNDTSNEKAPTLEQFLSLPYNAFQVSVISFVSKTFSKTTYTVEFLVYSTEIGVSTQYNVQRRYTEFNNLYDEFCTGDNPLIKLPEFPPKMQLGKEEKRIKYFDSLLKTIYDFGKNNQLHEKEFKKKLYEFIFGKNDFRAEPISDIKLKKVFKVNTNTSASNISNKETKSQISKDWTEVTCNDNDVTSTLVEEKNKTETKKDYVEMNYSANENEWSYIKVRSSMNKLSDAHIKINDQCLYVYHNRTEQNFYLLIPLYKINVDIFRIVNKGEYGNFKRYVTPHEIEQLTAFKPKVTLAELNSEIELKLYHDYDAFDFTIRFPSLHKISYVYSLIEAIERNAYTVDPKTQCISKIDNTNMNIYGNICLEIVKLEIEDYDGKCRVKIKLPPYTFQTKEMLYYSTFEFNQSFILPLHNRFIPLTLSVYYLNNKNVEEKKGSISVELPELLNYYYLSNNTIRLSLDEKTTIEFRFKNCSSFLALAAKNKNKKIIEDCPLDDDEEDDKHFTVGMCMKRIKRIMLVFSLFDVFLQNVFHFKYPIFSSVIMVLSMMYFAFCETKYLLTHILIFLAIILFSFSKVYQKYLGKKVQSYLFNYRNPYDEDSLYVHTVDEMENKQMGQSDYLVTEETKKFNFPTIKKSKEYKQTYLDLIFSITKIVAVMEKIKNLFLWTDPLLSFYFFSLVLILLLVVYNIEIRYILLVSFTKKFIKGIFYYKDKIRNNKAIAEIVLNHSKNKLKDRKFIESTAISNTEKVDFKNEKVQDIIITHFKKYSEVEIDPAIFKKINTFQELINEVGKCEEMLKIKKTTKLYHYQKESLDVFIKPVEPEDVFVYFVQNIKSDYYIAKHKLGNEEEIDFLDEEHKQSMEIPNDIEVDLKHKRSLSTGLKGQ